MNVLAIIGAAVGGALGALLWGVIVWLTDYEIGYVAWAVGGAVGGGAYLMGGAGKQLGIICGIICLVAILGGKLVSVSITFSGDVEEWLEEESPDTISKEMYDEYMKDAADFAQLESEDQYPEFLESHGYQSDTLSEAEELENFKQYTVALLRDLHTQEPSYETWRQEQIDDEQAAWDALNADISLWDRLEPTLSGLDLLFFGLGIFTAFSIVARREEESEQEPDTPQRKAAAAPERGRQASQRTQSPGKGAQADGVKFPKRRPPQA